jgi:4-amino-4-deoxy-L-arabinose transferase-like glycosyltransferase
MKQKIWSLLLLLVAFLTWFLYWRLLLPPYLTFSDAAKFADIARNFIWGGGYRTSFSVWNLRAIETTGFFPTPWVPPLFPLSLGLFFKIFSLNDLAVILTSGIFYLAGAITLFYLGKKIFGNLVGILASLAFIFDLAMLNYATSGASESLFIFELVLAALLIYQNTKVSRFFGFLVLLLMYFTRPSAIVYIICFVLLFIFLRFKKKAQLLRASGVVIFCWIMIELFLINSSGKYFLYPSISSFLYGTTHFLPTVASTATLRGGLVSANFQLKPFLSKFFYNLYNFYKLLPQILSPYFAAFFFLSLFRWEKEREKRIFRLIVLFMVVAIFIASAAFLPLYRYLHPVIPFMYLLAVEMLVWVVSKVVSSQWSVVRKSRITGHQSLITVISLFLLFVFIIGQTIGKIFLDSRYLRAHTNLDKPPVYVELAWILKENTKPNDLVVTNLDTWGSWYGERKTIWFPLEPGQLIPQEGKKLKIDGIYLTSYKMDDENYYMGEEWREIFYQPEELKDPFFVENFELVGRFEIKPEETYEKEGARAILLRRKE